MKKIFKLSFILLALLGVMFTSCKKDYPEPPIQVLPIGTVYTLDSILSMESGTVFNEDASVYGIITADERSGNLYKAAFMQDRATGKALELYMDATSGVRIGDSVRVYLKGVTYAEYNGLPQLSGFEPDGHIVILANDKPIDPPVVTIADIVAGNYLAGVVRLNNVMFTDKGTFADPSGYGKRTLVDPTDLTKSVFVRTSNYANFANDSLPQGVGNLTAIATLYNAEWRLLIRSASELEFDNYNPGGNNGIQTLPYFQSFATGFGSYSTFDVAGAQSWMIDYSTAKMAGFENSVNYANEDWLISAPVSFEGANGVSLTMTYIARYFNNLNEDITIQVSTDYESGDPNMATWTQVPASWTSGSDWTTFAQTTIDLSDFVGKEVRVAVRYLSTDQKAGTIEVQSIAIQEGTGPTPPPGPNPGGEVQSLPYSQSFTSDFGSYVTKDVMGAQSWEIDYSTAKMTGYVNGTNNANEDWLISSPVDLTGVNEATMTMTYIARYFNKINDDVTIWFSTDYVWDSDPSTATWTQVPSILKEGSNWNDFLTAEISLGQCVGQTVTIAVKYVSDEIKAGTIEIQNITIAEGSGDTPPTPPTPGEYDGDGTRENPYSANDIIQLGIATSDGNKYWVKDYITGIINSDYAYVFTNSTEVTTNLILSSNATPSSETECIPVQLPVGAIRDGLNLAQNPGNYQKEVLLYGTLENYFKKPGVKNVTYAEIDGNGIGTDPGMPPVVPTGELQYMPYVQSFETDFGTYLTKNVLGAQVWEIDFASAKMSGYSGASYDNEDWLISSPVLITGVEHAKIVVNYAAKYNAPNDKDITIQVSATYEFDSDPFTTSWTELPVTFANNNKEWAFSDLEASLDDFVGQTVTVAIKYTSTTTAARTIEIKTITVEEGEVNGDTPPTPPTPGEGEGSGTQEDPYNVAAGIGLQSDEPTAWVRGYIVGAVKSGNSTVNSNNQVNWVGPFDLATNVVIADDPSCNEISQCIIVNLPAGKPLRTQVNLMDNPGNLGARLSVLGKLRAYFGQAGLRDSNGTENDFVLEGGETPPTPPTPDEVIFSETFANGQGGFVIEDVLLPEGLSYVWSYASGFSCMKASGYYQQAYETESWLVSPAIDMMNYSSATLTFDQAVNYASPSGALSVMISTDYENTVDGATWTELNLSAWPAGSDWAFVTSSVDLTPYAGQIVYIAFKYTSTNNAAATWEVKNFVVK